MDKYTILDNYLASGLNNAKIPDSNQVAIELLDHAYRLYKMEKNPAKVESFGACVELVAQAFTRLKRECALETVPLVDTVSSDTPPLEKQINKTKNSEDNLLGSKVSESYLNHARDYPLNTKLTVMEDYLVCLEDGKRVPSLKRHLKKLGLTVEDYIGKWDLPLDYPRSAPRLYKQKVQQCAKMREKLAAQKAMNGKVS